MRVDLGVGEVDLARDDPIVGEPDGPTVDGEDVTVLVGEMFERGLLQVR